MRWKDEYRLPVLSDTSSSVPPFCLDRDDQSTRPSPHEQRQRALIAPAFLDSSVFAFLDAGAAAPAGFAALSSVADAARRVDDLVADDDDSGLFVAFADKAAPEGSLSTATASDLRLGAMFVVLSTLCPSGGWPRSILPIA